MSDIFIGRQPIFNVDMKVYAYELLFRSGEDQTQANVVDGDSATSQVMINTFVDIGLPNIVGHHKAFINLTQYYLEDSERIAMPPGQLVLEVLEDVEPNAKVVETLRALKKQGHTIALDDFIYAENLEPLVALADIVKIDVMALSNSEIEQHVALLRQHKLKLLAEKVETYEEFEYFKQLGFDFFQGYFFAKPTVVKGKGLQSSKLSILQLVAKINDASVDLQALSEIISTDISLSHKILKFVNSPASGLKVEVDSIQRAVLLLGLSTIKNWISIVALATGADKPHALSTLALVRARTCEQLASATAEAKPQTFFTAGLFSTLDAMLDLPLAEILKDLPLSTDLKKGLTELSGVYGEALRCAIAMERNDMDTIQYKDLPVAKLSELYLESLRWADLQSKALAA